MPLLHFPFQCNRVRDVACFVKHLESAIGYHLVFTEFTSEPRISSCHIHFPLKTADQKRVILTKAPGQDKFYLSFTCLEANISEGTGMGFTLLKARL